MKKVFLLCLSVLLVSCSLSNMASSLGSPTETPTPTQTPTITPVPMTDDEFSELALSACEELNNELFDIADSSGDFIDRYVMAAEAYQQAADNLSDLSVNPAGAPLAAEFMSNLDQLPGLYKDYGLALEGALAETGLTIDDVSYLAITAEDKAFMVFDGEEWHELVVEETLRDDFYSIVDAFAGAANGLGLTTCTAVDPIFD
jgi:hypothetical protein